jgi:wyosine [tRNA(Phe)-imidazoG37] synthetase (radical SAM superfamily)
MRSYVFGPVPSRRLGRSLGVDLVPYKTCSFDCVYCQLGKTTQKTIERREWVPIDAVVEQLETRLSSKPDYITLSGSGEPTLHSRIGELIGRIKALTSTPIAVLTNGTLLWQEELRSQIMDADLILPSLDAGDVETFIAVNRPHAALKHDAIVQGLIDMRREFRGVYWLEVLLVDGLNSQPSALDSIAACVERIEPHRVQLNTVVRPPAEPDVTGLSKSEMAKLALRFGPHAEVIADFSKAFEHPDMVAGLRDVLSLLERRPCSIEDIAHGLAMHRDEVIKYMNRLLSQGQIQVIHTKDHTYYLVR